MGGISTEHIKWIEHPNDGQLDAGEQQRDSNPYENAAEKTG